LLHLIPGRVLTLGGFDALVPKELRDGTNIDASLQQLDRCRVAEPVRMPISNSRFVKNLLQHLGQVKAREVLSNAKWSERKEEVRQRSFSRDTP
jgi:hypothetical protein